MGTAYESTDPALMQGPFREHIGSYSLFQAIDLCCKWLAEVNQLSEEAAYHLIRFHGNASLAFPKSDVESVRFYLEEALIRALFVINSSNLLGAGSPLPAHYCEMVAYDDESGRCIRDFLNIFNQRLQSLLYPIWKKYRYYLQYQEAATDPFSARMFALIGLGYEEMRVKTHIDWPRLLPYLGLLSMKAQSAAVLESVLRYYFRHAAIEIESCVARRVSIPTDQLNQLGLENHELGHSLVLGETVLDRRTTFRIHIGQLDWELFHYFLPIGKGYVVLQELVGFVLREPLAFDIALSLQQAASPEFALSSESESRLGWTSWLGTQPQQNKIIITGNQSWSPSN